MAGNRKNDLFGKLADLSEEAMQRLSDAPGGDRLVGALNATRTRVDELQKRVRGLETLEQRVAALERKVDKLGKSQSSSASGSAGKTTSAKKS
jgi:polyhydroxyalkanoate synthesis regulator phasin